MPPPLSCVAVDDEPLALELLVDNVERVPFLRLVKACRSAAEALEVMRTERIDLLLLDVQMPGLTGLQLLAALPYRPLVVLITAYEKYALTGYDLDVLDYLVKPVPFERFLRAATKAQDRLHPVAFVESPVAAAPLETPVLPIVGHLFVHQEYELVRVELAEIFYIEGLKDYLKIHREGQARPLVIRMTLKAIEERLPSEHFVRVHKSFIVAVGRIAAIRRGILRIGTAEIPLAETHREALFSKLGGLALGS
jgi:DNA-binding LytR/AlgR family response regulator